MRTARAASGLPGLLSVAGFDPTGGAGVLLDVRVFESRGFRGFGVITSVTAQSPDRFRAAVHIPGGMVTGQYRSLAGSSALAGIKVGMLGSLENLSAAARILAANPRIPRVIDPVLLSSSGARLLETKALPKLLGSFAGKADLITPNLSEAGALTGATVSSGPGMREAARRIHGASGIACLVKGGHLRGGIMDLLFDGTSFYEYRNARLRKSVHGTGCFLSAAILADLADGKDLAGACAAAIELTHRAIRDAAPARGGRAVFRFPLAPA